MRMQLFENLGTQTEISLLKSYQLGNGLMAKFNRRGTSTTHLGSTSQAFSFDLYDFDDHIFERSESFSTLEEAKWAALAAVSPHQRKAA